MDSPNLNDLLAFLTVAEELNFTRAAARLGVTPSALSQVIRALESRLELRLFARTTRSVSLTAAGERLLALIGPAMNEIHAGLTQLSELRAKPAGRLRLTGDEYAVQSLLMPVVSRLLLDYPDIQIDITTDYGLTDIVGDRFDAGVRRGGLLAKDMIAVQIGPENPMSVVGAPSYLAAHTPPKRPQDLVSHRCINLRLPTHGELFAWTFSKSGKDYRVKVQGPIVLNNLWAVRDAALSGLGLAYLPYEYVRPHLAAGDLVEVLENWRKTFEPYYLYYPHRRFASPAFSLLVDALRFQD